MPVDDSWKREAARAITTAARLPSAAPFLEPVSEAEAPGYRQLIAKPMDLGTVRANIRAGVYPSPAHAWADLQLVGDAASHPPGNHSDLVKQSCQNEALSKRSSSSSHYCTFQLMICALHFRNILADRDRPLLLLVCQTECMYTRPYSLSGSDNIF